ncbi:MAG TPA: hypothetical protein PKM27_06825 [Saprospiraceae bacterium]|nr:hypothetical protein [Saprospiraceae bacterium]HNT22059.1 hypothetical protein [Saprospiraceae bacterium]
MNTNKIEKSSVPEIAGDKWLEHWVEICEEDFASIEVDDFILID